MILYIDDLLKEINILNFYRGEAAKRGDVNADVVQSDKSTQETMMFFVRKAVTDILLLLNSGSAKFTGKVEDDCLKFEVSPVNEGKEYMMEILKEAIRQYLVMEVRRLWMMTVRPEWADGTLREELMMNMISAFRCVGKGERVRRRSTNLAGI